MANTKHLRSQELRTHNHQGDALRLGMNWTEEDLSKPQVLVESAWGMGHPGTFHFEPLITEVNNGVFEAGGKPAVFTVSDICDGVVQATSGMSYSLVSRDVIAAMVEIHALGHPHDGMVLISGNDKSVPAHLLAMARCNLPSILLPGGTQLNAPDYVTSDQTWEIGMSVERGQTPRAELESRQQTACPTCGACQFMGSASTGQVMAEAMGLALPGSALTPSFLTKHLRYARATFTRSSCARWICSAPMKSRSYDVVSATSAAVAEHTPRYPTRTTRAAITAKLKKSFVVVLRSLNHVIQR